MASFEQTLQLVEGGLAQYHAAVESFAASYLTLKDAFAPAENAVQQASDALALSGWEIKTILIFLLAFPLGLVLNLLPGATLKHVFSLTVGILLSQFIMAQAWVHPLITVAVSYLFMVALPRKAAAGAVFLVTLAYLVYAHYRRMINDNLNDDFSGPQMVLTIKLTTLAFQLLDGTRPPKPAAAAPPGKAPRADNGPQPLKKTPSLVEYFGFCYSFSSFYVGPAFHFDEYKNSITGAKYRKYKDASGNVKVHSPGGQALDALKKLVLSVVFIGYFVSLKPTYNMEDLLSETILSLPVLPRFVFWWITLSVVRSKFYFVWTIAEAGSVASGFGWSYKNDLAPGAVAENKEALQGSWDGVNNMDVFAFETAQNFSEASRAWNRLTSNWLRYCVYIRTPKPLQTVATYLVSAFWHGFYPGYYIFFVTAGLFQNLGATVRSTVRPHFVEGSLKGYKMVYDALCVLVIPVTVNYLSTAFVLLDSDKIWTFWSNWHFVGHIIAIVLAVLVNLVPRVPKKKHDDPKAAKPEALKKEE